MLRVGPRRLSSDVSHASQAPSDSEYQDLEDIEEHDPESHPFFLVFRRLWGHAPFSMSSADAFAGHFLGAHQSEHPFDGHEQYEAEPDDDIEETKPLPHPSQVGLAPPDHRPDLLSGRRHGCVVIFRWVRAMTRGGVFGSSTWPLILTHMRKQSHSKH